MKLCIYADQFNEIIQYLNWIIEAELKLVKKGLTQDKLLHMLLSSSIHLPVNNFEQCEDYTTNHKLNPTIGLFIELITNPKVSSYKS